MTYLYDEPVVEYCRATFFVFLRRQRLRIDLI